MNHLTLTTPLFEIELASRPGIAHMARRDGLAALGGNPLQRPNIWIIYDAQTNALSECADDSDDVRYTIMTEDDAVSWVAEIDAFGERISATVRACVEGNSLRFTLENFQEGACAHIVSFRLHQLAATLPHDAAGRMALPAHGGRLIDPKQCVPSQVDHRYNWILDSFGSVAVVYTARMTAIVRVHLMDDLLTSAVTEDQTAQVGVLLRHRYTINDVSYRRAKPNRDPKNVEDAHKLPIETDFALTNTPCATVELLAHDAIDPNNGWTIGACHVRDSLPGKLTDYYRGKMVYKIFVGAPNAPVQTNLAQIREIVFNVAARTGNAGQIPYLVGFQHRGHDSGYPDVFTLNPALESVAAMEKLFEDARAVHCTLSFHDNYDDAYADSPSWCADDISRDSTGHLLRGGVWNGVQAYWNSMPFYARNRVEERIARTLKMYPFLRETYHLDVLTASVFRIDFRGGDPSGRQQDLEARRDIAARFRAHGLDLTSEACGLPFLGHFSYFWHMQRVPRSLYEGDRRIPMVTFLAHGKADYAGTHVDTPHNILDGLLYGGFYCNDVTAATPIKELTDAYYMIQAPLDALRNDYAQDYEERNGWKTVRYTSGATVSVNFETEECRVYIDGKTVMINGCAMLPQNDGSTLLYRAWEEPYSPVRWMTGLPAGTVLTAKAVGVSAPDEHLTVGEDGSIELELPMGIGYRVNHIAEC